MITLGTMPHLAYANLVPAAAGQKTPTPTGSATRIENWTPHGLRLFRPETPSRIDTDDIEKLAIVQLQSMGTVRVETEPQSEVGSFSIQDKLSGETYDIPVVQQQRFRRGLMWLGSRPQPGEDGQLPAIIVGIVGAEEVVRGYAGPVLVTDTGPQSGVRDMAGNVLGCKRLQRVVPSDIFEGSIRDRLSDAMNAGDFGPFERRAIKHAIDNPDAPPLHREGRVEIQEPIIVATAEPYKVLES